MATLQTMSVVLDSNGVDESRANLAILVSPANRESHVNLVHRALVKGQFVIWSRLLRMHAEWVLKVHSKRTLSDERKVQSLHRKNLASVILHSNEKIKEKNEKKAVLAAALRKKRVRNSQVEMSSDQAEAINARDVDKIQK